MSLKHEAMIKRLFSEMHEGWMDDADKEAFDNEMMLLFGRKLDDEIEDGVNKHFTSVELQERTVRDMVASWRRRTEGLLSKP